MTVTPLVLRNASFMGRVRSRRSVEKAFQAGAYPEVLERTLDAPEMQGLASDFAYAVGALAFLGRLDEAQALVASLRGQADVSDEIRAAARFFLGIGLCRAGRHREALAAFRANLAASRVAGAPPIVAFYAFQGCAALRYFEGRIARAKRLATRSLSLSMAARSQYARLLASDLRGHALVQTGRVEPGLALLDQARLLAQRLELDGNERAIEFSTAIYRSRFGAVTPNVAIEELTRLRDARAPEDSYSRCLLQIELAYQLAATGRADEARAVLHRAETSSAPDGDDRVAIRCSLARAYVLALSGGDARPAIEHAREKLRDAPDALLELDAVRHEAFLFGEELRADEQRILARIGGPAPLSVHLDAGTTDRATRARELLAEGERVGLATYLLGASGRPWIAISADGLLLSEGGVCRHVTPVASGTLRLARALASRASWTREELAHAVWSVGKYHPLRHDPVILTAMSRLRSALGTFAHWVSCVDGRYSFAAETMTLDGAADVELAPETENETSEPAPAETARESATIPSLLAKHGELATSEIASMLGISEMTAFRRLRELAQSGEVERRGNGRRTRYVSTATARDEIR